MWSSFTIACPNPPSVVRDRLAAALTNIPSGSFDSTTFDGTVTDEGFKVTRNAGSMERAVPLVATGRLVPSGNGTSVEVATHPPWWFLLLPCGWSLFWVCFLWWRLVSDPLPGGIHWGEIALICGFIGFVWGLLFISCTLEERKYQKALTRIIAPTELSPATPAPNLKAGPGR